ncbi:hypothetical protein [Ferruginibacter profundus]
MKILTTFLFVVLFASCKTKKNTKIQPYDTSNLPKDSLVFYFPINIFSDRPKADSFVQNWYSSALYSFKEPLLSQNFVGHNIYRFLWLRSFHRPVVFTLHQSEDQVWLNTKILDHQPRFHDDRYGGVPKEDRDKYFRAGYVADKQAPDLLVRIADRKANIVFNNTISLSKKEWNEFEQLLSKANFWKLPTNIDDGSTDGARWVIEGHFKNKYHVVDYHSPDNSDYAKAGRFLIKLGELQDEKIY